MRLMNSTKKCNEIYKSYKKKKLNSIKKLAF